MKELISHRTVHKKICLS